MSKNVLEKHVVISTPNGNADGFLYYPEPTADSTKAPGVLYMTDIWGLRDGNKSMARELASHGYSVLMPNVFYRSGKPPIYSSPHDFTDERSKARAMEVTSVLTPEAIDSDMRAYVHFLREQNEVGGHGVAAVGFCLTGSWALRTAAAAPNHVVLAASFHGGGLVTDKANSPHELLPHIKAKLYFGHADKDPSMPQEAIDKLDVALDEWDGIYESEIYDGASHGWTQPDKAVYNPIQAKKAHDKLLEFLGGTLHP